MTRTTTDTPRVWVACLASYNAGRLIGEWVDAVDVDEMREATERVKVAAIEAAKRAGEWPVYFGEPEEFAIHDYDNFPGEIVSQLGEYPDWEMVAQIGAAIEGEGEGFGAFLRFHASAIGGDLDTDTIAEWRDYLCASGVDSEEDYAASMVEELGWSGVPTQVEIGDGWGGRSRMVNVFDELSSYIDWEKIARELFDHGSLYLIDGYVFDSERR